MPHALLIQDFIMWQNDGDEMRENADALSSQSKQTNQTEH